MSESLLDLHRELLASQSVVTPITAHKAFKDAADGLGQSVSWDWLLTHRVTILIGRANSGKSSELTLLANRLSNLGPRIFSLPLRTLYGAVNVHEVFCRQDALAFDTWKQATDEVAVFLLDSVDEAELCRESAFETCLRRISHQLTNQQQLRAKWVISTRPGTWTSQRLIDTIHDELIPTEQRSQATTVNANLSSVSKQNNSVLNEIVIATLKPLSPSQILEFLKRACDIKDPSAAVDLASNLGISFAVHSPGDLKWVASVVAAGHKPNSRLDAFDIAATQLTTPRSTEKHTSTNDLMSEIERLSAASVFCENTLFTLKDAVVDDGTLSLQQLLAFKPPQFDNALLTLPFVSEAGIGKLKFVPEQLQCFLAARWLNKLSNRPTAGRALMDLFRRESLVGPLIPSNLLSTAGWLATMNEGFRQYALKFAPQVVLFFGDASVIPKRDVISALNDTCKLWATGHPVLPDAISLTSDDYWPAGRKDITVELLDCFSRYSGDEDCARHLLKIFSARKIPDLVPAIKKYLASASTEYLQELSIIALSASGVAADLEWATWHILKSQTLGASLAQELAPALLKIGAKANCFVSVCKMVLGQNLGFSYFLEIAAEESPDDKVILAYAGALLTENVSNKDGGPNPPLEDFARALLRGYLKHREIHECNYSELLQLFDLLRNKAIGSNSIGRFEEFPELIQSHPKLRHEAILRLLGTSEPWELCNVYAGHAPLYVEIYPSDHSFLLSTRATVTEDIRSKIDQLILRSNEIPGEAILAQRNTRHLHTEVLKKVSSDGALLSSKISELTNASELPLLVYASQLALPKNSHTRYSDTDWETFQAQYGAPVGLAVMSGLKTLWRTNPPVFDATKPLFIYPQTIAGLMGLNLALAQEGRGELISRDDARKAFEYAIFDINQLPTWVEPLARKFPTEFFNFCTLTIKSCSKSQTENHHSRSLLHRLSFFNQSLFPAELYDALWMGISSNAWPDKNDLATAINLLLKSTPHHPNCVDLAKAKLHLEWESASDTFPIWYLVLLRLVPGDAMDWIEGKTEDTRLKQGLMQLSAYWQESGVLAKLETIAVKDLPGIFSRLYLVYCAVFPVVEMPLQTGMYQDISPEVASRLRDTFLIRLSEMSGLDVYKHLYHIGTRKTSTLLERRRIYRLALRVAESTAKRPAWSVRQFLEFETRGSSTVNDEQSLWLAVRQDVDEAIRNLDEGAFSLRNMLSKASEHDMQHWLARELELLSANRYTVWREPEHADKTAPDIVAHADRHRVTMELKVADSRTVDSLLFDLNKQLVGDYLKSSDSNLGIFIVMWKHKKLSTYAGKRNLSIADVRQILEKQATKLCKESLNTKHVSVRCFLCPATVSPRNAKKGKAL